MAVEQRGFDGQAVGSAGDSNGDMNMKMEVDMDIDNLCAGILDTDMSDDDFSYPSSPSTTYSAIWSSSSPGQAPSTPQSIFSQTCSTPKSSGSSFSETIAQTPTPANNAFAPMPNFSGEMDGVVQTRPRGSIYDSRHAGPGALSKNGIISFTIESADPQQSAAQQPATQPSPTPPPPSSLPPRRALQPLEPQAMDHLAYSLASFHFTDPVTYDNTAASLFGPYIGDRASGEAFKSKLDIASGMEHLAYSLSQFHFTDPVTYNRTAAPLFGPYIGDRVNGEAFESKLDAASGMDALIRSMESFHTTEPGETEEVTGPAPYVRMARSKPFMFDLAHTLPVMNIVHRMTGPSFHVTKEKDQNWTKPTVFGPFVGKKKSEGFEARFKATAAAFAAGRAALVQYVDKGKGVTTQPDSTDKGEGAAAEPQSADIDMGVPTEPMDEGKGVAIEPHSADNGNGVAAGPQPQSTGKGKGKGIAVPEESHDTSPAQATTSPATTWVLYDYGYANEMMDQMYSSTLPRLAVEFDSRDKPWYTEDRRQDDVDDLKAKMDHNDLNDTSFNTVDEAYLERPTLDRIQLFDLFDDWWTEDMNDHLSSIFRDWSEDDLVDFGNALRATFYAYMDGHPPAAEAAGEDSQ